MKRKKKNNQYLIAIVISLLISVFYYILNKETFTKIFVITDQSKVFAFYFLQIFCSLILASLLFTIYYFIVNRKKHKSFIKHFIIYFSIMLVFLILLWPGIFKGDEYYVLRNVYKLSFDYKQHYFTSLFYMLSLNIIPTLGGITFFQNVIISSIVAYVLSNIEKYLKNKKLIYLMYIPLLVPPVIDNNMFNLRSSIISYLLILLVFQLLLYLKDNNNRRLIYSSILVCIITNYKSEYIYLPFIFLLFILIFCLKKFGIKTIIKYALLSSAFFIIIKLPQHTDNSYIFISAINPMSILIQDEEVEKSISEEDKIALERLVEFDNLKNYPDYYNTSVYFTKYTYKNLNTKEKIAYFKAYFRVIINNPGKFLKQRTIVYILTNFADDYRANHTGWEEVSSQWTLEHGTYYFIKNNYKYLDNPFGEDFKHHLVCLILLRNYEDYTPNALNHYFYNVTPSILLGTMLLIYFIIKKRYKEMLVIIMVTLSFPLLFLTAPANFWMYYVSLYIVLNFIFVYYSICYIEKRGR